MKGLFQDLRYGIRTLIKNPGFTAVAVLTLALGIGGTTAIFSVLYAALRNPFPDADSERLVVLVSRDMAHGQRSLWASVSASEFLDYREQNHVFDEILGGSPEGVLLTDSGVAQNLDGCRVTTNTFQMLGVPPLFGKAFTAEDGISKYFETESPLGQQIKLNPSRLGWGIDTVQEEWFEIVGVVADTRHMGSPEGSVVQPTVFIPYMIGGISQSALVARTTGEPVRWLNSVRQESAAIDKELPVEVSSLRDELEFSWFTEPRFVLTMLIAFASLGLVLVSVGVYSVLSYAVSRRTQEIGIRMALGAQATDLRRMVLMSGLCWLAVGIGIGVPTSVALARILQNRIWGIKSADPLTLAVVPLLLVFVGLAACYVPARWATRVDPLVALRYE